MAKTTVPDTVVIIDDEPYSLSWMLDYIDGNGLKYIIASNVNEAINVIEREIYRVLVIDLNIPVFEPFRVALIERGGAYARFPGLFVAERARNRGYRNKQVVIYSVHRDAEVASEAKKLDCTYILKGRPKEIKAEIEFILSYDPTADDGKA